MQLGGSVVPTQDEARRRFLTKKALVGRSRGDPERSFSCCLPMCWMRGKCVCSRKSLPNDDPTLCPPACCNRHCSASKWWNVERLCLPPSKMRIPCPWRRMWLAPQVIPFCPPPSPHAMPDTPSHEQAFFLLPLQPALARASPRLTRRTLRPSLARLPPRHRHRSSTVLPQSCSQNWIPQNLLSVCRRHSRLQPPSPRKGPSWGTKSRCVCPCMLCALTGASFAPN